MFHLIRKDMCLDITQTFQLYKTWLPMINVVTVFFCLCTSRNMEINRWINVSWKIFYIQKDSRKVAREIPWSKAVLHERRFWLTFLRSRGKRFETQKPSHNYFHPFHCSKHYHEIVLKMQKRKRLVQHFPLQVANYTRNFEWRSCVITYSRLPKLIWERIQKN